MTRVHVGALRPESPLGLAALRIAIAIAILVSPELWQAPLWAATPPALRFAPEGLAWALRIVPIDVDSARVGQALLVLACVAALFGARPRLAMLAVTVSGLYVFGLSQLSGAVIHDMHLFWLSGLLSVSPCGDALSLTRWVRRVPTPPPSAAWSYSVPLQFARVLLGIVYFFPGFWKLAHSGFAWISSDNLRNQLYWKWYERAAEPPWLRIDHVPWVLHLAALSVVSFELGFIVLIWSRRGRLWAAAGGVLFHIGTQWWMGVTFVSLLACYVVLIDWPHAPTSSATPQRSWPAWLVGTALVAICVVQGARGATQAWPFACYPTFDRLLPDTIADLRIEAVRSDGASVVVPDGPSTAGMARSSQAWARAWQLAGLYGSSPDAAAFRAYWRMLQRDPSVLAVAQAAVAVRFYAATYSVLPERRGQAPLSKRLVYELR
jgi:hypothetical protein